MRYPGAADGEIAGLRHVFAGAESGSLTRSVLAYTFEAARFVRRFGRRYDVIVENFLPSTPIFSRLLTPAPVVLQVQGVMQWHALRKFNPFYAAPMFLTEAAYPHLYEDFIFVSPVTRDRVLGRRRDRIGRCDVIPNGIGRELLDSAAEEGDYMLFFSRIDIYTKGLDILMRAFTDIAGRFPGLRLVLAGYEFDSFARLRGMLPEGLRGRVEYAGFLSGAAKTELLSRALLAVLPSRHESAPISIIEAAACGKPVIVSDIPELRFVEAEGMGVAFETGSAEGLARKMSLLLADRAGRKAMGLKGRDYAGRFLWDRIAPVFENALQSMADEKKR